MKKLSLALLSAVSFVALTTGCSSTEVLEEGNGLQTGAIVFGANNVAKASRTDGILKNDNFNTFHVYGYYTTSDNAFQNVGIFNGDAVKLDAGAWKYNVTRYWLPNATYNFYAYSCGNMSDNLADGDDPKASPALITTEDGKTYFAIEDFIRHGYHDLIFAEQEGMKGSEGKTVELKFTHILTRVRFSFKSEVPDNNYQIAVEDLKLSGLLNEASYNVGGHHMWTDYSAKTSDESFKFGTNGASRGVVPLNKVGNTVNDNAGVLATEPIFVIPNKDYRENSSNYENFDNTVILQFTMIINRKKGDTYEEVTRRRVTATWKPVWDQGHSVNNQLTLTFNNAAGLKPIEFKAEIIANGTDEDGDTWQNENGGLQGLTFTSQAVVN